MHKSIVSLLLLILSSNYGFSHDLTRERVKVAIKLTHQVNTLIEHELDQVEYESLENDYGVIRVLTNVNQQTEKLTDLLEALDRMLYTSDDDLIPAFQRRTCHMAEEIIENIAKAKRIAADRPIGRFSADDELFKELNEIVTEITNCIAPEDSSIGEDIPNEQPPTNAQALLAIIEKIESTMNEIIIDLNAGTNENDSLVTRIITNMKKITNNLSWNSSDFHSGYTLIC